MNVYIIKWSTGGGIGMGAALGGLTQAQACLPWGFPKASPSPRHPMLCFLSLGVPQAMACPQAGYSTRQGNLKLVSRSDWHMEGSYSL